MTNYERIKNMSVEEMAEEIERMSNYVCDYYACQECPFGVVEGYGCTKNSIVLWLESEVKDR